MVTPVLGKIIVASMPWRSMSSIRAAGSAAYESSTSLVVGGYLAADLLAQAAGSDPCELAGSTDEAERLSVEGNDAAAVVTVVHAERAISELGSDVALEEIERLVVVVVGVDDLVVDGSSNWSSGSGHLPMV